MKKFLLLFLTFGLYLSTSAQSFNIDDLCGVLPETADVIVATGAPASYLSIAVSDGGMLDGTYPGWCVDTENGIALDFLYEDVPVYCSYETLPADLLVTPDNLDLVNWILNNVSVDGTYTMGDIQYAIWMLISDVTELPTTQGFWDYLGDYGNASAIKTLAETNGEGFVPGYNEYVAIVFDAGTDVQTFIIPFLIPDAGCTFTQGYWKTHADPTKKKYDETWDLLPNGSETIFYLSGDTYIDVFNTPVKGNKYYSLAHQFMAVQLNFLNDANQYAVLNAYNAAKVLFENYTPAQVKADSDLNDEFGSYIDILTDYNEGTIGPGHCDDKSAFATIAESTSEMNIYPNPMTNNGTIDFTVENEAQTIVEIYNVMGQRVATLFDSPTQMGQQYQLKIDANRYQKGLYIVYLKNGSTTVTRKININ